MATRHQRHRDSQDAIAQYARDASAAHSNGDDHDDAIEPSLLTVWCQQSPSWLVSMAVHMAIFLMLALYVIQGPMKEKQQIKVFPEDVQDVDDVDHKEFKPPEPVQQPIVTPVNVKDPEPADSAPPAVTPVDEVSLAAKALDFDPVKALASIKIGDSSSDKGTADKGLGSIRDGIGQGHGIRIGGGRPETIASTKLALKWLVRHQNRDGSWSFNHTPGDGCSGFPDPGEKTSKMGATGLALMALLGAGHSHQLEPGDYDPERKRFQQSVLAGVKYLIKRMDVQGDAGRLFEADGEPHSHMYCHGIAACALAEAYGMRKDPWLHDPAQYALNYIVNAQGADGGWRYQPGDLGDTSALGWQLMAFKSGKASYLSVPGHVYPQAGKFLDAVQKSGGTEYGYMPTGGHGATSATSSIGLLCRVYLGWPEDHPGIRGGAQKIADAGPHPTNMYYNYYATMFMYQSDGPRGPLWRKWNDAVMPYLLDNQVKKGGKHLVGSWHFPGDGLEAGMSDTGGRLYNTAMAAMMLEVYYRYKREYDSQRTNI